MSRQTPGEALAKEAKALRQLGCELEELQTMGLKDLRVRYEALFGELPKSKNLPFLRKQLAFRLQERMEGGLTVSIEARHGVSTGMSAYDRATTILTAVKANASAQDLVRPGHVFPLIAKDGGVLVRPGQTEGSVDLARLSGCGPAGVICEIMNEDGTMARMPELEVFARTHGLKIVSVKDLIAYSPKRLWGRISPIPNLYP